jgi:hypothetical protein
MEPVANPFATWVTVRPAITAKSAVFVAVKASSYHPIGADFSAGDSRIH